MSPKKLIPAITSKALMASMYQLVFSCPVIAAAVTIILGKNTAVTVNVSYTM